MASLVPNGSAGLLLGLLFLLLLFLLTVCFLLNGEADAPFEKRGRDVASAIKPPDLPPETIKETEKFAAGRGEGTIDDTPPDLGLEKDRHREQAAGDHNNNAQDEANNLLTEDDGQLSCSVLDKLKVGHDIPADQLELQQKRCSKYSQKSLLFAITMFAAYIIVYSSSIVSATFKVSMVAFSVAILVVLFSEKVMPKWLGALIYLSWFLLVLVSYLLLVSLNKYYGYTILPVPLPIVAAFLHHNLRPGVQQTYDHGEDDLEGIFDWSAGIVNCGGFLSMIIGHYLVGPNKYISVSAVGCLFFFTIVLGLYLMMITTVRNVVLISHAIYLDILFKVLVMATLIATMIYAVGHAGD